MELTAVGKADNRFPLSFYYRLADQLINQAKECRDEHNNVTDLYNTLTKYCNLISKIPQHRSYTTIYSSATAKENLLRHNKIHQESIKELERLKPLIGLHDALPSHSHSHSHSHSQMKCQGSAKTECYSPSSVGKGNVGFSSSVIMDSSTGFSVYESPCSTFSTKAMDCTVNVHFVTQSSPSLALSYIENMPHAASVSHIDVAHSTHEYPPSSYRDIHISARLMEDFLELASDNTNNDLETCGILGAFLKDEIFYVTTLIIPKQESTSSSCQALNEEEIYAIQDEHSLFPVGWIHTHPSQTCFMSSIDLHTHFSYQVMLPEAIAIVMAPTDPSRSYGIFRLSNPSGITVVKDCDERGFHSHQEPSDGRPIYEECSNVYINRNMRFEIFDLR